MHPEKSQIKISNISIFSNIRVKIATFFFVFKQFTFDVLCFNYRKQLNELISVENLENYFLSKENSTLDLHQQKSG